MTKEAKDALQVKMGDMKSTLSAMHDEKVEKRKEMLAEQKKLLEKQARMLGSSFANAMNHMMKQQVNRV